MPKAQVRIDNGLVPALVKRAKENRRSMAAEANVILEVFLKPDLKPSTSK